MRRAQFFAAILVLAPALTFAQATSSSQPPVAEKVHTEKPINGAVLVDDFAWLREGTTVRQAWEQIGHQSEDLETIYYMYLVDDEEHLRGVISARQLVTAMNKPNTLIDDLAERAIVSVDANDDQNEVAVKVAQYDLHAIPVVGRDGTTYGATLLLHDASNETSLEQRCLSLHSQATRDPLTQVANRAEFDHDGPFAMRDQLIKGTLVVVRYEGHYAVVPDSVVQRIRERDEHAVVGGETAAPAATGVDGSTEKDDPYKDFVVPDDLRW